MIQAIEAAQRFGLGVLLGGCFSYIEVHIYMLFKISMPHRASKMKMRTLGRLILQRSSEIDATSSTRFTYCAY